VKKKIINILTHIPQKEILKYSSADEYVKNFPLTEFVRLDKKPFWVGFFKLDWHHRWGKEVKKLFPDVQIECWRPYGNIIDEIYEKDVEGIKHKVFPSWSINIKKYGSIEHSQMMLEELQKEINKGQVLIHFYGAHTPFQIWLINKLKPKNTPIVYQHLGWGFGFFEFLYNKNPLKLLHHLNEIKALKYVDYYLTSSIIEEKYLKKKFLKLNVLLFYNGINFDEFPSITKEEARQKLKIPQDKKVILYVGRYDQTKSVDLLLNSFIRLKRKFDNIELYLVGGYEEDEFFNDAIKTGAKVVLRSDRPIYQYYASADVYVLPVKNKMHQDFGGTGIAPLEALFYNVPVISPSLKHFPCNSQEKQKLGIYEVDMNRLDETIEKVLFSKNNDDRREIVLKYMDINKNTIKLIKIYNYLFEKYYK